MIDTILDIVFWVINAVVGLLPEWSIGHDNALVTLATTIATFDQYFPITDLFQIITIYLVYYGYVIWIRPLLSLAQLR